MTFLLGACPRVSSIRLISEPQCIVDLSNSQERRGAFTAIAYAAIAKKDNSNNSVHMNERTKSKNQSEKTRSVRLGSHGWYFKTLGTWIDNQLNEELAPLGLSLKQFAIIMTILEQEGLTQSEIGQRVMQPSYATTRNIDKLESLGYVRRQRHETSRRSHRLLLTEAGRALAPDLYQATQKVNDFFLSSLEEKQQAELLKILTEAASNLGLHK